MLTYYPQLNNLPFCNRSLPRKPLRMQTTTLPRLSSQTSLRSVGQFQANLTAHQYFPGILCRVVNREEKGRTPLPQGSHRTIQRLCNGCRGVSVTVRSQNLSLTRESVHRTKPQEKTLDFILLFMNLFFIIITSLTSEWSPGFYHSLSGRHASFSF